MTGGDSLQNQIKNIDNSGNKMMLCAQDHFSSQLNPLPVLTSDVLTLCCERIDDPFV